MLLNKLKSLFGDDTGEGAQTDEKALELASAALMFEVARADFAVDEAEQQFTNSGSSATAEQKKYNPAHAGWVGIQTYTDGHGNLRVKTEVLVAGSSITGDAADDAKLPE